MLLLKSSLRQRVAHHYTLHCTSIFILLFYPFLTIFISYFISNPIWMCLFMLSMLYCLVFVLSVLFMCYVNHFELPFCSKVLYKKICIAWLVSTKKTTFVSNFGLFHCWKHPSMFYMYMYKIHYVSFRYCFTIIIFFNQKMFCLFATHYSFMHHRLSMKQQF